MIDLKLSGMDGSNPLAFLAALGVLIACDERHQGASSCRPRLGWELDGVWRPVLKVELDGADELVDLLDSDRRDCAKDPVISFSYEKESGKKVKKVFDLKPPPSVLRASLLRWVTECQPDRRRTVDWMVGFVSEGALDNNGAAKPTALHFTAGQQQFLKAAKELVEGVRSADIHETLFGSWSYGSKLPVMGWDNTETRDYALRAMDPSGDKKLGNPAADWLAIRGLLLLPTAARRSKQQTAGVQGGWKTGNFAWPLWQRHLTVRAAGGLLTWPGLRELSSAERERLGIGQVMEVRILRSDQGGYGSVTPAAWK
ncbi:MAG: hypothetical protein EA397_15930 [Deltaproteobacteria bacterium]|nr:MAG: hypothetical protein EA397_15930 [Deltaproteobacteria bacterium]